MADMKYDSNQDVMQSPTKQFVSDVNQIQQQDLNQPNAKTIKLVYDDHNGEPTLSSVQALQFVIKNYTNKDFIKPKDAFVKIEETNISLKEKNKKIDVIAILEEDSLKDIDNFIVEVETYANRLYNDFVGIIKRTYNLNLDEQRALEKEVNEFDKVLDQQINLTKSVIYNIDVDWNPQLIAFELKKDLYPNQIVMENNGFQTIDLQYGNNEINSLICVDYKSFVKDVEIADKATNRQRIQEVVNYLDLLNNKISLKAESLSQKISHDPEKFGLKLVKFAKDIENQNNSILDTFQEFKKDNSHSLEKHFNKAVTHHNQILENIKNIRAITNLDTEAKELTDELLRMNNDRDALMTKLAILYSVAFNDNLADLKNLNHTQVRALANNKPTNFQEGMCDLCLEEHAIDLSYLDVLADDTKQTIFNKYLKHRYSHYLHGRSYSRLRILQRKYTFDEYVHFLASEAGILNDLQDLFSLLEKDRIDLMLTAAVAQADALDDRSLSIEVLKNHNFEMLKVLTSELLVLKTIAIHISIMQKVKNYATQKTPDYMRLFVWDKYLDDNIIDVTQKVSDLFYSKEYRHNLSVQYLYHELKQLSVYEQPIIDNLSVDLTVKDTNTLLDDQEYTKIVHYFLGAKNNVFYENVEYIYKQPKPLVQIQPITEPTVTYKQPVDFDFGSLDDTEFNTPWELNGPTQNSLMDNVARQNLLKDTLKPQDPLDFNFGAIENQLGFMVEWGPFYKYDLPIKERKVIIITEKQQLSDKPKTIEETNVYKFGAQTASSFYTYWGDFTPKAEKEVEIRTVEKTIIKEVRSNGLEFDDAWKGNNHKMNTSQVLDYNPNLKIAYKPVVEEVEIELEPVAVDETVILSPDESDIQIIDSSVDIYEEEPEEVRLRRLKLQQMGSAGRRMLKMIEQQKKIVKEVDELPFENHSIKSGSKLKKAK